MTFPFTTYVFGRLFSEKEKKRISKGGVKVCLTTDLENVENIIPHFPLHNR